MAGFINKIKEIFMSEEEREIRARMKFNQTKKDFLRYYSELDASIKDFSRMAQDAEISGNHANALSAAAFVGNLQRTQTKVQGLLQRFEMMRSMQRLAGVMTKFMGRCAEMGVDIDSKISFSGFERNAAGMSQSLGKLEQYADQLETVFQTIDEVNMAGGPVRTASERETDAEETLNKIMGRKNALDRPAAQEQKAPETEQVPAAQAVREGASPDELAERIRIMRQELSSQDE